MKRRWGTLARLAAYEPESLARPGGRQSFGGSRSSTGSPVWGVELVERFFALLSHKAQLTSQYLK